MQEASKTLDVLKKVHLNKLAEMTKAFDDSERQVVLRNIPTHMLELELARREDVTFNKIQTIKSIIDTGVDSLDQAIVILQSIRRIL